MEFWLSLGVVCEDRVAKAKDLLGEAEEGVASGGLHKVGLLLQTFDCSLELFTDENCFFLNAVCFFRGAVVPVVFVCAGMCVYARRCHVGCTPLRVIP